MKGRWWWTTQITTSVSYTTLNHWAIRIQRIELLLLIAGHSWHRARTYPLAHSRGHSGQQLGDRSQPGSQTGGVKLCDTSGAKATSDSLFFTIGFPLRCPLHPPLQGCNEDVREADILKCCTNFKCPQILSRHIWTFPKTSPNPCCLFHFPCKTSKQNNRKKIITAYFRQKNSSHLQCLSRRLPEAQQGKSIISFNPPYSWLEICVFFKRADNAGR